MGGHDNSVPEGNGKAWQAGVQWGWYMEWMKQGLIEMNLEKWAESLTHHCPLELSEEGDNSELRKGTQYSTQVWFKK